MGRRHQRHGSPASGNRSRSTTTATCNSAPPPRPYRSAPAGRTGEEQIQLQVAGQTVAAFNNVAGNYSTGQFVTLSYTSPTAIPLSQIRVAYTNDGNSSTGVDRNLASTPSRSTASATKPKAQRFLHRHYVTGQGRVLGKLQTEYPPPQRLFSVRRATGSVIEIRAAGRTGEEQMQLQIAGTAVATFSNVAGNLFVGQFQSFVYLHPDDGRALRRYPRRLYERWQLLRRRRSQPARRRRHARRHVSIRPRRRTSSPPAPMSPRSAACSGLLAERVSPCERLLPVRLNRGSRRPSPSARRLISVNEGAGTVSIPVVRTGGSDGTVGLRYTTVNATAARRQRLHGKVGPRDLRPGETTKSIVVPITNDLLDEISETFNLAVDQSIGGATVNQPRTGDDHHRRQRRPPGSRQRQRLARRLLR